MPRKPITLHGFTKGLNLKGDCLGEPGFMRLVGFKFGSRAGVFESRGGPDDWDTSVDFQELNGIKRWYDSEGGATLLAFGNNGSNYGLWRYDLESKSVAFLQQDTDFDRHAPVQFVNCDNQIIHIPYGKKDSPYTTKLRNGATRLVTNKLGLPAPTDIFTVSVFIGDSTTDWIVRGMIYKWAMSYSYGTKSEPNKYGESALGPVIPVGVSPGLNTARALITDFTGISGLIQRINIYRTLGNGDTFYKVGEINDVGIVVYEDLVKDSLVNLSKTAPTATGLPGAMVCALWHPTFKRLYWFGTDGYFHWSAGGYADINPISQRMEVGSLGYPGRAIALIRSSIYCFKEDGIYLVQGDAPNYYSIKVSSVQCMSSTSVAEMPDGIYFMGMESGKVKVFRFNGNNALPITEAINDVLPSNKQSVFKRAFGRRVGDEYWLSLMVTDKRFCRYPVPWNNTIIMYDYRYGEWSGSVPCQASSIEVFDGPSESGEIFITESDPTNDVNKGTFFRWELRKGTYNSTIINSGSRSYSKTIAYGNFITYGTIPAFSDEDNSLENIATFGCKLRVRGYDIGGLEAKLYADDLRIESLNAQIVFPEQTRLKKNDLVLTGDSSVLCGTGKTASAKAAPNLVEDYEFYLTDDKLRSGVIADIKFTTMFNKFIEVEALEFISKSTYNE